MIEILGKEYKDVLVVQLDEIDDHSHMIQEISKPQVIHIYDFDMHLLSSKMNVETLIYYIRRFRIDFLAINIPLTKYIKKGQVLINKLKMHNRHVKIIATGEAITTQIAKDIGADGFTSTGDDLVRIMEKLDHSNEVLEDQITLDI